MATIALLLILLIAPAMPFHFPAFLVGPSVGWWRDRQQNRRKVKLTVHQAQLLGPLASIGGGPVSSAPTDCYFITVTNASPQRDIVVTHVWIDSKPPVHVHDPDLPKRLKHSAPWEVAVPVSDIPAGTEDVEWLARCMLSPDDKVVKSRPRRNVPPFGTVPRG